MFWTIPLAIFTSVLIYQLQKNTKIHRNGEKLRRPPDTLPLLGNAIRFLQPRHVLFDWFVKCQQRFGIETYEISVPTLPPGVVISSPENIEFVLKNEALVTKGEFFKKRSWDLFGYGIINATGELWKAQRKAGLKFFSGANLEVLVDDVMPEVYSKTRKELLQIAESGEPTDLQRVFLDLTTAVVGQMAYDMAIKSTSPFSRAFDYASDHIALRFQNPLYPLTELFTGTRFRAALHEVKSCGHAIVANARKRRSHAAFESLITNDSPAQFTTLIDSLLDTFSSPTIIADAAMNFLSAGRDTTAQALTWTLHLLVRHPDALARLRAEIDATFLPPSENENDSKISVALLTPQSLPYTHALLYESLRLFPPVPIEIKQTASALTLPDGTFLPTGAVVVWCIWAINRSENIYPNSDPQAFRPDRWLDSDGTFKPKSAFEFPVFNGGPRACLGKRMAEVMVGWVLGMVVGEFEFEEVFDGRKKERRTQNSLTLPMEGGLPLRAKLRRRDL